MKSILTGKVKKIQIIHFFEQVALMLKAGIPLAKAIDSICNPMNSCEFKAVLITIRKAILSGESLSQAMGKYGHIFSEMDICCIKMAEESGKLSDIMDNLSKNGKQQYLNEQKFISVITYPIIVFILSIFVIWLISQTVISQIYPTLPSRGLVWDFFIKSILLNSKIMTNPIVLLYTFIKIFLLYKTVDFVLKNKKFGGFFQKKLWNMPIVKESIRSRAFCDFFRNFTFLYESGVDINKSLELAALSSDSIIIKNIALSSSQDLLNGMTLSESLHKYFPRAVTIFVKSGEESGNLTKSLKNLCKVYQQKTDLSIEMAMNLMEPVMIISIGIFTTVTALVLLSPIYDSIETMGI